MNNKLQTPEEQAQIQNEFEHLLALCKKGAAGRPDEIAQIVKAFEVANQAHAGVRRRSGEPYILHPIAVAKIVVSEIGLGYKSVCAALLHDVVEDTELTVEDIRGIFGDKIAYLVEGLTKIAGAFGKGTSNQAENFKRILLTLSDDVRVIIIKIADRLHNMRTLGSMPVEKQQKIANETLYLFAPLAYRLGFYKIKTELEDLCLKYLLPDKFNEIYQKIQATEAGRKDFFTRFSAPIIQSLKDNNIKFDINARTKSVYSVWRKMQAKNISFEEVYDLFAVRIIFEPTDLVPERTQCYHIYSLITDIYRSKTDRLRDWVNTPKANGYEALHCTVMMEGTWVEVQIRTQKMDEIDERGFAAHWKYKDQEAQESDMDKWLGEIRDLLSNPSTNAIEFLDEFKMNLFSSEISVFTPKGQTISLPKESTALDFAYNIHTQIGNKAIAAKVNHRLVPLSYKLSSGDLIEILTADNAKPQKEWLDYVTSTKARNCIQDAIKSEVENHIKLGKEIIESKLKTLGIEPQARVFRKILPVYGVTSKRELYSKVGAGLINIDDIEKQLRKNAQEKQVAYWGLEYIKRILPGVMSDRTKDRLFEEEEKREEELEENTETVAADDKKSNEVVKPIDKKQPYLLQEDVVEKTLTYKIAPCCKPIPGDDIIVFTDFNGNIIVHRKQCPEAIRLAAQHGDRIINAKWATHRVLSFLVVLEFRGIDRIGILNELTTIITGEMNVNTRKLSVESHDGIFEGVVELYVHNTSDLNNLLEKISKIKGVESVHRVNKVEEK